MLPCLTASPFSAHLFHRPIENSRMDLNKKKGKYKMLFFVFFEKLIEIINHSFSY